MTRERREFFSGIPEQQLNDIKLRRNTVSLLRKFKKDQISRFIDSALETNRPEFSSLCKEILEGKKKEYKITIKSSNGSKSSNATFVKSVIGETMALCFERNDNGLKTEGEIYLVKTKRNSSIRYREGTRITTTIFRQLDEKNTQGAIMGIKNFLKEARGNHKDAILVPEAAITSFKI